MAVISTTWDIEDSWVVSGRAVRQVIGRAVPRLTRAEDLAEMEKAVATSALQLEFLDPDQAARIAAAVYAAARDYEGELRSKPEPTDGDLWFANSLVELQSYLKKIL